MPVAVFIHDGNSIDYTPGNDVASGAIIVQGDLVGVAKRPIPANTLGALCVAGVFDFPKATGVGSGIAVGVNAYWDETNGVATTDANGGANKHLGKTTLVAGDDDATVRIRMNQ